MQKNNLNSKIIYSKRVKEQLEDIYHIYPIARILNPTNLELDAWIFKRSQALTFAINEILNGKGENANGKSDR